MKRSLSEAAIVRDLAENVCRKITQYVVRSLQKTPGGHFSEGCLKLATAWDEICVQVQFGHSPYWRFYEHAMASLTAEKFAKLPLYEREAVWLQTQEGLEWHNEDEGEREQDPVVDAQSIAHIVNEYVCAEAGRWTNSQIRKYWDRSDGPGPPGG